LIIVRTISKIALIILIEIMGYMTIKEIAGATAATVTFLIITGIEKVITEIKINYLALIH
tara:strand:- start:792 stop:971 length:180 start_codon:yes stop_codon:yes gene_type:complete